jgi:hypothetical protein
VEWNLVWWEGVEWNLVNMVGGVEWYLVNMVGGCGMDSSDSG